MRRPRGHAEDVGVATLDKKKEIDVATPPCWCGDICKVKVSTDRKKSWTEDRRFFVCPNYAYDRARPTNAYDLPPICYTSHPNDVNLFQLILLTQT